MASASWRRDRLTGRSFLLVPPAPGKPFPDPPALQPQLGGPCPFCAPACYTRTPEERGRRGSGRANADGWTSRSFTNGWPVVPPQSGQLAPHEVIVLSPDHERQFADMGAEEAGSVMGLMLERARFYGQGGRHPLIFMNYGRLAGATQPHPHAQVLGLGQRPPALLAEATATTARDCAICEELADASLCVATAEISIWCPAASRPWELRIAGRAHDSWPVDENALGAAVGRATRVLRAALGAHAYVLVIHVDIGHWHAHLVPRLGIDSGIVDASGLTLSTEYPDRTASLLRNLIDSRES